MPGASGSAIETAHWLCSTRTGSRRSVRLKVFESVRSPRSMDEDRKSGLAGNLVCSSSIAGRFHEINAVDKESLRGISGIVETANGDLWLNGLGGIFHVRRAEIIEALKNAAYRVKGERFGRREGLPGLPAQFRPIPTAIEGTDGRLWFAVNTGVVWLDPARASKKDPAASGDDPVGFRRRQGLSPRFTHPITCPHLQRSDQLCRRQPFGPGGDPFSLQAAGNGSRLARISDVQRELPQSTSR